MANFNVNRNGYTEVYTDGACKNNGRGNAKAGVGVWFGDNNPYNVSRPAVGRPTNNNAEIQSATLAARQAQRAGVDRLQINTDSEFLKKSATEWMPRWKDNGWKTAAGHQVVNKREFMEMDRALQPFQDVKFNHVRGHNGNYGNEQADRLARQGSDRYGRH